MASMFYSCSNLQNINFSNIITNKVKDTSYLFYRFRSLVSLDLNNFNTNEVANM